MSGGRIFLIRAVISLAASFFVTRVHFGRVDYIYIIGLAAVMVFVAYVFEAMRRSK